MDPGHPSASEPIRQPPRGRRDPGGARRTDRTPVHGPGAGTAGPDPAGPCERAGPPGDCHAGWRTGP